MEYAKNVHFINAGHGQKDMNRIIIMQSECRLHTVIVNCCKNDVEKLQKKIATKHCAGFGIVEGGKCEKSIDRRTNVVIGAFVRPSDKI